MWPWFVSSFKNVLILFKFLIYKRKIVIWVVQSLLYIGLFLIITSIEYIHRINYIKWWIKIIICKIIWIWWWIIIYLCALIIHIRIIITPIIFRNGIHQIFLLMNLYLFYLFNKICELFIFRKCYLMQDKKLLNIFIVSCAIIV